MDIAPIRPQSLLDLPTEIILQIVISLRNVDSLISILQLEELRQRLAPHLRIVTNYQGPVTGFPNVEGIQRQLFDESMQLLKSKVYLVDRKIPFGADAWEERKKLRKIIETFKNTNTFLRLRLCEREFPDEIYEKLEPMNICAVLIRPLPGQMFVYRFDVTTDNIHFENMHSIKSPMENRVKQGARMDFGNVAELHLYPTQESLIFGSQFFHKVDALHIQDGYLLGSLRKALSPSYALRDLELSLSIATIHSCNEISNVRLVKSMSDLVIGTFPSLFIRKSDGKECIRSPLIHNFYAPDPHGVVLDFKGYFPVFKGDFVLGPRSEVVLRLENVLQLGDILDPPFSPERNLTFLRTIRHLTIHSHSRQLLEHGARYMTSLETLIMLDNSRLTRLYSTPIATCKTLRISTMGGKLPEFNMPNLEVLDVRFNEQVWSLEGVGSLRNLKVLKLRTLSDKAVKRRSNPDRFEWPLDLRFESLQEFTVSGQLFGEDEHLIIPRTPFPMLRTLELNNVKSTACLGSNLDLNAPLLESVTMTGCLKNQAHEVDEPELRIDGYEWLQTLTLKNMMHLSVSDCPCLTYLIVYGHYVRSVTVKGCPSLKHLHYPQTENVHKMEGCRCEVNLAKPALLPKRARR